MGRVYEALKRAGAAESNGASKKKSENQTRRNGTPSRQKSAKSPAKKNGNGNGNGNGEHPWDRSPLFNASNVAMHPSASTAHTVASAGSALPGGQASRAAGATLDAVGSTRVWEFVSQDISATRVEPHLVAITQPRSAYCEQFRSLRTRVIHAGERKKMQTFVISSSGIGEGKTLTALNLAWLLAQTDGVRALLIDSDLRQPCVSDYLGIETPVGLSEVLTGEATLEDSIMRLEPAGLHYLPGGAARDDCAELLSGPKFGSVLSQVRQMFNYIIIDAPPLGIFTDATVLINRADGALLVVRAGKTRYSLIESLLNALPRDRMLGVVLNRSEEELSESNYYYQQRRYIRRQDDETTTETEAPAVREEATA